MAETCRNGHPREQSYRQASGKLLCRPCHNGQQHRWNEKNRPLVRAIGLRSYRRRGGWARVRYGLTPTQRADLFVASDGLCALCYERPATVIDHDHDTGEVRGTLCQRCNVRLGTCRDDAEFLERALEYLEGR